MTDHTGLVSISFRKHTAEELIAAAKETGITAIEWGSDIHVPAGDTQRAAEVKKLCEDSGIAMPEYGSYYYLGLEPESFEGKKTVEIAEEIYQMMAADLGPENVADN